MAGDFLVTNNSQTSFRWCGAEVWRGRILPAQMSSSSSDCGSKLRGPSQNISRVASKWDDNMTKLNLCRKSFRTQETYKTSLDFQRTLFEHTRHFRCSCAWEQRLSHKSEMDIIR
ncbi:hypothetical protein AVEN_45521-1 [Araneus ventricosus]|uniref:Uncharacterized protein n=1 Tax=Araneus ventricosus TaxID=182803 RepID=A0A4Y2F1J1_ARAVE|nr:hypothetical protein AVEN_45521-1 [Araneus ventricosus]